MKTVTSRKQKVGGREVIRIISMVACSIACMLFAAPAVSLAEPPADDDNGQDRLPNYLSFPVLWAEGVPVSETISEMGQTYQKLTGTWWYWWGTDADGYPLSCRPDPDNVAYCDDGQEGTYDGPLPGDGSEGDEFDEIRVYQQRDPEPVSDNEDEGPNEWLAGNTDMSGSSGAVEVDWVDWGDALESVDWYTKSKVRIEVGLYKKLAESMLGYDMRHLDDWGIDELWGVATYAKTDPETEEVKYFAEEVEYVDNEGVPQASVYSHCARLTIQQLNPNLTREELKELVELGDVDPVWNGGETGWTATFEKDSETLDVFNSPAVTSAVYESAGEDSNAFSAEINVKGKVIYGYLWLPIVTVPDETAGDYRITFSFDDSCQDLALNTVFSSNTAIVSLAEEEEEDTTPSNSITIKEGGEEGKEEVGGEAQIKPEYNLTFIDVRIHPSKGNKANY